MEKRISFNEFQSVKAVAKAIDPIVRERNKIKVKIETLVGELKSKQAQIEALEAGIVSIIGFHVEELVKKVIEPTGATDKNGKAVTITKYLPTNMVSYDDTKKQYVITIPDAEGTNEVEPVVPPTTVDGPGSDFDVDAENFQAEAESSEEQAVGQESNMPWNN